MSTKRPTRSAKRNLRRRDFLGRVGTTGALLLGYSGSARGYPANESVRVGCIGTGGRSLHALMPAAKAAAGVRIVAACDIWDRNLEEAKKRAEPGAFATKDHHALLARADVDAVIIATPDHLHVPITVDACAAGKDVYVEKPLTHDLAEGQAAVDAQNRHRRVVQVGMQQRSMPQFIEAYETIIRPGVLGKIHKVHLTWNRSTDLSPARPSYGIDPASVDWKAFLGRAPGQPFDEFRFRNWRWIWDFGGGIFTDLMVHFLDVANWYLDLGAPASAVSVGDHFQTAGLWETPDTVQTLLHYPERRAQVYFEGTFFNARNAAMLEFMGTNATLYIDRGRYEVHPERGKAAAVTKDFGGAARGADFSNINCGLLHVENWISCVRSRKTPAAPAEEGVRACLGAHLANRALRSGGLARWSA